MNQSSQVFLVTVFFTTLRLHVTTEDVPLSQKDLVHNKVMAAEETETRIFVSESSFPITHQTATNHPVPRYLQLGNQTVDVNVMFKVPISTETQHIQNSIGGGELERRELARSHITENSGGRTYKKTRHRHGNYVARQDETLHNHHNGTRTREHHHHYQGHNRKYGPHFEDILSDNMAVTVQAGDAAQLDCKVSLLMDKTVSWIRRKSEGPPILLTVGALTYTGDARFSMQFRYPGNWRLLISPVNKTDEGVYECQVSTHPPTVIRARLLVEAPQVTIVDESGTELKEQYYEVGSTLQLRCLVKGATVATTTVWWFHGVRALHKDPQRGGIAVKTDTSRRDSGSVESILRVGRLGPTDAGNYSCALPPLTVFTVLIHVLTEESLGELQQGSGMTSPPALVYVVTPGLGIVATLLLAAIS